MDASWQARVSGVETVANLAPIYGWEDSISGRNFWLD